MLATFMVRHRLTEATDNFKWYVLNFCCCYLNLYSIVTVLLAVLHLVELIASSPNIAWRCNGRMSGLNLCCHWLMHHHVQSFGKFLAFKCFC